LIDKKSIVIVDDSAMIRNSLRPIYESLGLEILGEFAYGLDALEGIRSLQPDYLSLDIILPDMNGFEILEHIAQDCPDVKILIVSVLGNSESIAQKYSDKLHKLRTIGKPFDHEMIKNALAALDVLLEDSIHGSDQALSDSIPVQR